MRDSKLVANLTDALNMESFIAYGNSRRHVALLSRFPIAAKRSYHPWPPICNTILEASVNYVMDHHLHLFGIHLYPHPFIFFEWRRRWEIGITLRAAMKYHHEPCLIAGDFNAIAPNDRVAQEFMPRRLQMMFLLQGGRTFNFAIQKVLSAGFIDCFRHLHSDAGFTLPTTTPDARLDYIFANPLLSKCLLTCDVGSEMPEAKEASDHYPVIAEFEMNLNPS